MFLFCHASISIRISDMIHSIVPINTFPQTFISFTQQRRCQFFNGLENQNHKLRYIIIKNRIEIGDNTCHMLSNRKITSTISKSYLTLLTTIFIHHKDLYTYIISFTIHLYYLYL
ncbi:hypothetical protein Lalb_Chr08g0243581 [Lupinus albus]|uniref:Uncharacterized protein n=1 Tax=Lupinus albus TaxID=3870 RepID=A0A6A4Q608_LUPAL|nr:hypothetical protein Lalb_Chr08g0243581 [Lupinus albus]